MCVVGLLWLLYEELAYLGFGQPVPLVCLFVFLGVCSLGFGFVFVQLSACVYFVVVDVGVVPFCGFGTFLCFVFVGFVCF